ncbi:hypothetical protein HR45_09415 [Shewanella mangrovi]|uniref:Molecular chaperone n=1 Tax=Shewanella mangrovi TaxID=1515746 RepID=A0A094JYW3_9GAMM|nr:molecular chaperone TorD family protein [Shewanella mangrovi]KFZ37631.1 hypothetical protein HR45_09415 [Shewanella mangrovi]
MNEQQDLALALKTVAQLFYQYPRAELLSLMSAAVWQEWPTYRSKDKCCVAAIAASELDFEQICADYTRMFIGPGKKLVYPWSSVHLDEEPLLFGESTQHWEHFCRRHGIAIAQSSNEPSDHFALILWVLAELYENTSKHDLCTEIITRFYLPWIPMVLSEIEKQAQTVLYRELAKLVLHYVTMIQTHLCVGETTECVLEGA